MPGRCSRRSGRLKPAERYETLAGWVLPTADHPVFRLQGEFSPTCPPPLAESKPARRRGAPGTRVETGGPCASPRSTWWTRRPRLASSPSCRPREQGAGPGRGQPARQAGAARADRDRPGRRGRGGAHAGRIEAPGGERPRWTRPNGSAGPSWPSRPARWSKPKLRPLALALLEAMATRAQRQAGDVTWERQVKNVRRRGWCWPGPASRASRSGPIRRRGLGTGHAPPGRDPGRRRADRPLDRPQRASSSTIPATATTSSI